MLHDPEEHDDWNYIVETLSLSLFLSLSLSLYQPGRHSGTISSRIAHRPEWSTDSGRRTGRRADTAG